jgi:hypothetical protein
MTGSRENNEDLYALISMFEITMKCIPIEENAPPLKPKKEAIPIMNDCSFVSFQPKILIIDKRSDFIKCHCGRIILHPQV